MVARSDMRSLSHEKVASGQSRRVQAQGQEARDTGKHEDMCSPLSAPGPRGCKLWVMDPTARASDGLAPLLDRYLNSSRAETRCMGMDALLSGEHNERRPRAAGQARTGGAFCVDVSLDISRRGGRRRACPRRAPSAGEPGNLIRWPNAARQVARVMGRQASSLCGWDVEQQPRRCF